MKKDVERERGRARGDERMKREINRQIETDHTLARVNVAFTLFSFSSNTLLQLVMAHFGFFCFRLVNERLMYNLTKASVHNSSSSLSFSLEDSKRRIA